MREAYLREDRAPRGSAARVAGCNANLSARPPTKPIVFVVDRDAAVCRSLEATIHAEGWQPELYQSADTFLSRLRSGAPSSLVLDATLVGALEVQRRVTAERPDMPIIFTTDHDDLAMVAITAQAMKAGAAEFFNKPLDEDRLVSALREAITHSQASLDRELALRALRERYARLSSREQEVMRLVVTGRLNKQVGGDLGISEITVKAHRGKVMRKMGARTFVDLLHMAMRLSIAGGFDPRSTASAWLGQAANLQALASEPGASTFYQSTGPRGTRLGDHALFEIKLDRRSRTVEHHR